MVYTKRISIVSFPQSCNFKLYSCMWTHRITTWTALSPVYLILMIAWYILYCLKVTAFSTHSTHTHTCWKWKSTNYHKWLNRTCPCFGTIDFLRKSIAKLIPPRFFPLRYVRWWPLPPTNHLVALTTNSSKVSLSENSGDGGPPREAATSPSDGHLVDEDPEDDEDVSPDKDIGRSSEEQLKVACKKKRKKEKVILQSWSLRY